MIKADTKELEAITTLFERRAQYMVNDSLEHGARRAAQQQSRKRPHPGIKHARYLRHRTLSKVPGASMIARAFEIDLYRRIRDFFGSRH
jgi:hypothetical protein